MAKDKNTPKRRGRAPAKLNVEKPGVGMAYVGKTMDENGKTIHVRIGTTCARDTNKDRDGELIGAQLTNYSGVVGKGMGEKYFTGKLARKGRFNYLLFLCSEHHKKCMGAEVKAEDLLRENIENTIARILKKVKDANGTNKDGVVIINGFIDGVLDFEWLDLPWKQAKAEGKLKLFEVNKQGHFEEIATDKPVKKAPAKKAASKKSTAKKTKAKSKSASKKSAAKTAKASGAAKKPAKKKGDPRSTFYGIKDGKAVTKRATKMPEGYFATKKERDEVLKGLDAPAAAATAENTTEATVAAE